MSLVLQSCTVHRSGIEARLGRTQNVIDSEVLRRCEPLVPLKTGMLAMSGKTHTVIGSGKVRYNTPYARYQYYYGKRVKYNGGRGRRWFGRMKFVHMHTIKKKAQEELNKP